MGKHVGISLVLIGVIFIWAWLWGGPGASAPEEETIPPAETEHQEETPPETGGVDAGRTLRVLLDGAVTEMTMAEYLRGVVRAEMPASFAPEALKAQAVAARTYVRYHMENGGTAGHPEADVCGDPTCCQAYLSAAEAAANWGDQAAEYEAKIDRAVAETDGECVLYEDRPILAAFHSSSAGATQDAANVWSSSLPYLQSVESPENEDTVPNYRSTASFSAADLKATLQAALPEAALTGDPSTWFTNIRQEENGTVTSLTVGGVVIKGSELRTILGLRSACFTISFAGDTVTFSVTGYGHGVGMSQYGANVLAADGMDYREILAWYYTGTTVAVYP